MTPAFEHHDRIAAVQPGTWLRCVGPVKTNGPEITLQPGTMLRAIRGAMNGDISSIAAHFDAGGRLKTVFIHEAWWHALEIVDAPGERDA